MTMHNSREIVTITNACKLAGVSRRTLYNWMNAGLVEWVLSAGGPRRVYVDTLFKPAKSRPRLVQHHAAAVDFEP